MSSGTDIDITFDFWTDTPHGKDPDSHSPTLHRYHQVLWCKPLPSGQRFELRNARPKGYLCHHSPSGEIFLSSDSAIPTFRKERKKLAHVFAQISEVEQASFLRATYTIGGMRVFPSKRIDRKNTINGARGFNPQIKDRFDLTMECIRLHYEHKSSPLGDTLARYASFFDLFGSFRGYVDFFLLQDIVTADYAAVRFHTPFFGFDQSPIPADLDAYVSYRRLATEFIQARGQRILNAAETGASATQTP